ncbi:hypothetical protein FSARC_3514 [Fusarium sarcochroum]|uniref:Enoyl reductase (ER) domain-containing protein n=1 Tax=Fusarium sarcochroum TaxID=1208366 RepID=A0A8H4XCJ2_9HYPO|nr:hypothetical protein FSARC_3514 [Fusarium sarcochroum]
MTITPNKSTALYANEVGKIVLHDLPAPEPQEGEVLIKVLYSGVNLSDIRTLQFFGLRNYALGGEFCGRVLETPNLADTPFKAGDLIAGVVIGGINRASRHATHQEYISIPASWAFKVPENVPPSAAAGLGIVVIASAKRHEFLKQLGATQCFDYHDENVVDKFKTALRETKGTIWGFDAFGSVANPVSQDVLASVIPPHDKVRPATVLLSPHDGFEITMGGRNFDIDFDLPDGTRLFFPKDLEAADRMWRAVRWVLEHYGTENVPTPARVAEGSGKDAIQELYKMSEMGNFGKVLLKHPLK